MKPEQRLWAKKIRPFVKGWGHFCRIENDIGAGQPDVNYCIDCCEGWIELKVWPRPLEPTQENWIYERQKSGGMVRILVELPGDAIYLIKPVAYIRASELKSSEHIVRHQIWNSRLGWDLLRDILSRVTDKEQCPGDVSPEMGDPSIASRKATRVRRGQGARKVFPTK